MAMQVELVSPEAAVWSGEATQVLARTLGGGDIAFLSGHAPFLGALDTCVVVVTLADGKQEKMAVRGGFVEVSDNHVKILSDQAQLPQAYDPDQVRAALARAEEALRKAEDDADLASDVRWENVRLQAADASAVTTH